MKAIILLALVLVAANSYTLWDNWHNVPTTFSPTPSNATHNTWGLSGWSRNGVNGQQHYSGEFNDYSYIFSQYMYWKNSNPDILIFCGPKYYLYSETLCRVDPYFKHPMMPEYCLPNYFNYIGQDDHCSPNNVLFGTYTCCYDN